MRKANLKTLLCVLAKLKEERLISMATVISEFKSMVTNS